MTLSDALRLIAAKSPNNTANAARVLRSVTNNTPVAQRRAQYVLEQALRDPMADFTPNERAGIASLLSSEADEPRNDMIRVRVSDAEKAEVQRMADEAGQNVSDYVRERLGL